MKKKLIAILLIIALMLTACSGGGKDKDPADKTADPTAAANAAPTDAQAAPTTEPTTAPAPTEEPDTFEGKTLDFDFAKKYQTIDGFGAAFTWYAERLLRAENSEGGFDALFNDLKLYL